jgi:hypothetical protein
VRVLEALKILEEAVLDSKKRDIDTPEVRIALDLLDPFCSPKWQVDGFRKSLRPTAGRSGASHEGQQQVLRVYFGGIYRSVRALLQRHIRKLAAQYARSKDETVKDEFDRLTAELAKLAERWEFYIRKD